MWNCSGLEAIISVLVNTLRHEVPQTALSSVQNIIIALFCQQLLGDDSLSLIKQSKYKD